MAAPAVSALSFAGAPLPYAVSLRRPAFGLQARFPCAVTTFSFNGLKNLFDGSYQPFAIVVKASVTDRKGVPANQQLQIIGQIIFSRHRRPVEQNGNYPDFPAECRGDLHADEILRIIKPTTTFAFAARKPLGTDDRNQHIAGTHALFNRPEKSTPGLRVSTSIKICFRPNRAAKRSERLLADHRASSRR